MIDTAETAGAKLESTFQSGDYDYCFYSKESSLATNPFSYHKIMRGIYISSAVACTVGSLVILWNAFRVLSACDDLPHAW